MADRAVQDSVSVIQCMGRLYMFEAKPVKQNDGMRLILLVGEWLVQWACKGLDWRVDICTMPDEHYGS